MLRHAAAFVFIALYLASASAVVGGGQEPPPVTFSKEVAPILNRHCVVCHRPGQIAPMSLLTYADAQRRAGRIRDKVVARQMPPWHADPHFGEFANERRLSEEEIAKIVRWVEQGAREGDPKDLPPPPAFAEGWQAGAPDAVVSIEAEHTLDAEFTDNYLYFRVPTHFKEDRWVQSIEFRPGNRAVVHHAVAFIETPEQAAAAAGALRPGSGDKVWTLLDTQPLSVELMDGTTRRIRPDAPVLDDGCAAPDPEAIGGRNSSDVLSVYAPGREPDVWPAGTAKKIPAGSNIIFQMHYSKRAGRVERDRTSVGLVFARAPVEKMVGTRSVGNERFAIPPGAENHRVTACWTYQRDVELISFMPHMHVRGKSMRYELIHPDGRRETLLDVPRYSFHWQTLYTLRRPIRVESGARLAVTAHFDNSARNHHNPDPTRTVRHGSATFDEMMIGFVNYVVPKPPERRAVRVDAGLLDAYVGQYEFDAATALTVSKDGGRLFVEAGGQRVELLPVSDDTFAPEGGEARLTFIRDEGGRVTGFVTVRHDQRVSFRKRPR